MRFILPLFLLLALATVALSQAMYPRPSQLEATTVLLANTNHTATGTNELQLYKSRGLTLFADAWTTNDSTAPITLSFDVSGNGTNWTTTAPITWTFTLRSNTLTRVWTNIPAPPLDNLKKIRLAARTNGHNATAWITNLTSFIQP